MCTSRTPVLQVTAVFLLGLCCSLALFTQGYTDDRFNAGRDALSYENNQQAVTELRLACLGMMEIPASYAHCKSLLFLAQLGNRQKAAATTTLFLIARLEENHSAYSNAALSPQNRSSFEAAVLKDFADETFLQTPRFAAILTKTKQATLSDRSTTTDSPRSLADLRRLASKTPENPALQEELTLRLYQKNKVADALRAAETLGATDPGNETAQCIRATVRSARNRSLCSSFLDQIATCPEPLQTPFYVETRLRCYSETKAWTRGRDYLNSLSASSRSAAHIEGLAKRITKRASSIAATVDLTGDEEAENSAPRTVEPSAQEPAAGPTNRPDPALLEEIAATRTRAGKALTSLDREGLTASLGTARTLADQNPTVLEAHRLSGELAYLLTEWQTAVDYLAYARQLGDIGTSHIFYLAAAYYETGKPALAANLLQESLDRGLMQTEIVDTYQKKIIGQEP